MLELHHWEPNVFFLKPLVALEEKGAEWVSRWFDPTRFEQFGADFPANQESRLHLEREGPLLVHDGEVVSGSYFMLEYIAESLPGPELLPGGAWEHYRARAWGQLGALTLAPIVCALGCARYLVPALAERNRDELRARISVIEPIERRNAWLAVIDNAWDGRALEDLHRRLELPVSRIERALGSSRWLAGDEYSIADIDAFALLRPLPDLAPQVVNERKTPRISEFLARMHERPAVRAALARSRSGRPHEAFVPGPESSRWG